MIRDSASTTDTGGDYSVTLTVSTGDDIGIRASVIQNSGVANGCTIDWTGSTAGPYAMTQLAAPPKGFFGQTWRVYGLRDGDAALNGDTIPNDGTTITVQADTSSSGGLISAIAVDDCGGFRTTATDSGNDGGGAQVATITGVTAVSGDLVLADLIGSNPGTITADEGTIIAGLAQSSWTGSQGYNALQLTADATSETLGFALSSGEAWGLAATAIIPAATGAATIDDPGALLGAGRGYDTSYTLESTGWTDETWSLDTATGWSLVDEADGTATLTHDGTAPAGSNVLTVRLDDQSRGLTITVASEPTDTETTDSSGEATFTIYEAAAETSGDQTTISVTMNGVTETITRTKP